MQSTKLNFCPVGGLLVGTQGWLPESPYEYNWGTFDPRIGCNRLVCGACGAEVRHLAGVVITNNALVDPAKLYATPDWLTLPYVQTKPELAGRLYACRCRWRMQFGSTELDPPIPESEREFQSEWRCNGHPWFKLPGDFAKTHFNHQSNVEGAVRSALAGTLEVQPPQIARVPGYLAMRLYILFNDAGLGDRVGRAVATNLTDAAPLVRRAALEFFYEFPKAAGADQIALVARDHRALFAGQVDPTDPRYDLEEHLLRVLEQRLSTGQDRLTLEVVRQELLQGTRRPALLLALAEIDRGWVRDDAGDIVQANPGILKKLLNALHDFSDDDVVAALKLVLDRKLVGADELRQTLEQVFQFEPERGAQITGRLLPT